MDWTSFPDGKISYIPFPGEIVLEQMQPERVWFVVLFTPQLIRQSSLRSLWFGRSGSPAKQVDENAVSRYYDTRGVIAWGDILSGVRQPGRYRLEYRAEGVKIPLAIKRFQVNGERAPLSLTCGASGLPALGAPALGAPAQDAFPSTIVPQR